MFPGRPKRRKKKGKKARAEAENSTAIAMIDTLDFMDDSLRPIYEGFRFYPNFARLATPAGPIPAVALGPPPCFILPGRSAGA